MEKELLLEDFTVYAEPDKIEIYDESGRAVCWVDSEDIPFLMDFLNDNYKGVGK